MTWTGERLRAAPGVHWTGEAEVIRDERARDREWLLQEWEDEEARRRDEWHPVESGEEQW